MQEEILNLKARGSQAFTEGRYEEAAKLFTAAIKLVDADLDPHLASVLYSNRAACSSAAGMHVSSMVDAKLSLRLDSSWAKPYIRLASALCGMLRYSDALQVLDEGLKACGRQAGRNHSAVPAAAAAGAGAGPDHSRADVCAELQAARDTVAEAAAAHARRLAASKKRRLAATAAAYGVNLPGQAAGTGTGSSDPEAPNTATVPSQGPAVGSAKSGEDVLALAVALLDEAAVAKGWTPGRQEDSRRVHVTCVSGFLGAGKTTLLSHLLRTMPLGQPAVAAADGAGGHRAAPGTAGTHEATTGTLGTSHSLDGGHKPPMRVAVIVNDLAAVNVDGEMLRSTMPAAGAGARADACAAGTAAGLLAADVPAASKGQGSSMEIVELSNGCICCGLKGDLVIAVAKLLAQHPDVGYLLIEATGVGVPAPIAGALVATDSRGRGLQDYVRLDTCVTVVDTPRFASLMSTPAAPAAGAPGQTLDPEDARPLAELLAEQVEFADVVVLNKVDAVQPLRHHDSHSCPEHPSTVPARLNSVGAAAAQSRVQQDGSSSPDSHYVWEVEAVVRALNPRAHVLRAVRCAVDPAAVTHTHTFDMELALQSARWQQELGALVSTSSTDGGPVGVSPETGSSVSGSSGPDSSSTAGRVSNRTEDPEGGTMPAKRVRLLLGGEEGDDHVPETQAYKISSVVYEARAPFHPGRLLAWLSAIAPLAPEDSSHQHEDACHHHTQPGSNAQQEHGIHAHDVECGQPHGGVKERESSHAPILSVSAAGGAAQKAAQDAGQGQEQANMPSTLPDGNKKQEHVAHAPAGECRQLQGTGQIQAEGQGSMPQLLRAKGFLWVACMPQVAWEWSVAGAAASIWPFGRWLASMLPADAWPQPGTREGWDPRWGDRKQSLVLIGQRLDGEALRTGLDGCLLTQEELGQGEEVWEQWDFGPWRTWAEDDEGAVL